jgi:transposase-like protein
MATGTRKCLHCEKELSKQQVWRNCKYCSRKCFADGYWGEPVALRKIKTRSKKFLAAYELCKSGMTQAETARLLGVHPQTVSGWFTESGVDWDERRCAHCNKPLDGTRPRSNRKYCNGSCANKAQYLRSHPEMQRRRFDPELRAKALELYWGGLEGRIIATHLDLPEGTLHSWIHDFGHLRRRRRDPEMMRLLPVNLHLESATKPKEWQKILRENAPDGDHMPVILVCGDWRGNGAAGYLATIVCDTLKRDPRDGVLYAFYSSGGDQISTICWQRGAFCLTKMPKSVGGYIWPKVSVGTQIEVRQNEFEFLLSLKKKSGPKPYFT